ncbi:MAG: AsmA-like C-terminal region-containing protein [Verrucomicrobiota bacterium]
MADEKDDADNQEEPKEEFDFELDLDLRYDGPGQKASAPGPAASSPPPKKDPEPDDIELEPEGEERSGESKPSAAADEPAPDPEPNPEPDPDASTRTFLPPPSSASSTDEPSSKAPAPDYPLYPESGSDEPEPDVSLPPEEEADEEDEDPGDKTDPSGPASVSEALAEEEDISAAAEAAARERRRQRQNEAAPASPAKGERLRSPYDDEAEAVDFWGDDEEEDEPEEAKPPRPPLSPEQKKKRLIIAAIAGGAALIFIGIAVFFFSGGTVFSAAWAGIDSQLSSQGIYVRFDENPEKISANEVRLKNVALCKDETRTLPFITLSEVNARVTRGNDATGGGLGIALTLEEANFGIDTGNRKPTFRNLTGVIEIGSGGIVAESLTATFQGLVFNIQGQSTWKTFDAAFPPDPSADATPAHTPPDPNAETHALAGVDLSPLDGFMTWAKVSGGGAPLKVDFQFSGPDDQPLTATLNAAGQGIELNEVPVSTVNVQAQANLGPAGRTIIIGPAELVYDGGIFSTQTTADLNRKLFNIDDLHSTLDLTGFLSRVYPPFRARLETFSWTAPPELRAKGAIPFTPGPGFDLEGALNVAEEMTLHLPDREPLPISKLETEFTIRDDTFATKNFVTETLGGLIVAEFNTKPFGEPLAFAVKVNANNISIADVAAFLGNPNDSTDALSFTFTARGDVDRFEIPELKINHLDKSLSAQAAIDRTTQIVDIASFTSDLHLIDLAQRLHAPTAERLNMFKYSSGPTIELSGRTSLADPNLSDLSFRLASADGFVLDLAGNQLSLANLDASFTYKDGSLVTEGFKVDTLGGTYSMNLVAKPFEENVPFAIGFLLSKVQLQGLADFFGEEKTLTGQASLNFQGKGTGLLEDLNGTGQISIEDGEFYIMPVLGTMLASINSAGVDIKPKDTGSLAGPYAIENGVLSSNQLLFKGEAFEIFAPGKVDLLNEEVDILVQIKETGKTDGKALETRVLGPFADIDYDFGGRLAAASAVNRATPPPVAQPVPPPQPVAPQPAPPPAQPPAPPKKKSLFEFLNPFD